MKAARKRRIPPGCPLCGSRYVRRSGLVVCSNGSCGYSPSTRIEMDRPMGFGGGSRGSVEPGRVLPTLDPDLIRPPVANKHPKGRRENALNFGAPLKKNR